ncbi:MAG: MFS transporter [Thermoplasmata archaeon]
MNRRLILLTTSIASFITPFTSTVITFAVPGIGSEFSASFNLVTLVPVSFLISLTSLMITLGRLSDIYGRPTFLRLGFLLFIISSILIYISQNIYQLIFFIFIGGVGGALLGTNSTAIITHVYDKNRGGALGINAMSVYLGLTLAPFLGGIIIQLYGWRSIFLFNILIATSAFIISMFTLKEIENVRGSNPDFSGMFLFSGSLLSITSFLTTFEIFGLFKTLPLIFFGILLFMIFIMVERRKDHPLIDINIFRNNRTFTFSNISAFLNYLSTFSIVFIFSIYLQIVLGIGPFYSGIILSIEPILMVAISPLSGRLSDFYGSREIAAIGTCIIGVGFILLYALDLSNVWNIIISLAVIGIGFGLFTAPNTNSVMGSAGKKELSLASGILGTMRFTGQILSIVLSSFIISSALPRSALYLMFTGYMKGIGFINSAEYVSAIKTAVIISAVLSFLASFTSLMKSRGE